MPPVVVVAAERVLRLARRDLAQVVAQRRVDVVGRAGPGDHRLAEVADVEDADGLPDGGVLLDHAGGVLQRHAPAAELGELRPESDVPVVQRGLQERRRMARTYRRMRPRTRPDPWLECAGDDVPPAQRQPCQDPLRRRRRRSRAVRQGRAPRPRCGGRRRGLRPQAAAPALDARLQRQAGRDRQAAHGRHDLLAAAGDRRPRRRPRPRRDPPRRRRRRAGDQQRLVGRAGPARRHARAGAGGGRGLRPGRLHVHGVQAQRHQGHRRRRAPTPSRCSPASRASRRPSRPWTRRCSSPGRCATPATG